MEQVAEAGAGGVGGLRRRPRLSPQQQSEIRQMVLAGDSGSVASSWWRSKVVERVNPWTQAQAVHALIEAPSLASIEFVIEGRA